VVKKLQETKLFKNFTKAIQSNYERLFFRNSLFCNLGASRYAPVQEQGISFEIKQRKYGDARFYRFGEKENNRIRWGLLAQWSSSEQKERRSKTKNDHERQFFNTKSERTRLQQRSPISNSSMSELSDRVERKFVRSINVSDWEVSSDSGWVPITHIHKTIKYKEWVVKTISGKKLICADDHIVFDAYGNQTFIKNLKPNSTKILTENGPETVISVYETDKESNMFDLTVNSNDHRLYTNGILSHNTTTVVGYLLWYILFDEGKLVAILANKAKTSREILDRIKFAYEQIPIWMQQGITAWNKGDIELENKCRIIADSTSGSAARGYTIHFLYLDEFAFVPNNVAEDFFTSVFPTISSGTTSKILISSTPNGMNHFYRIWKEAEEGVNGFHFIEANWRQVPGRDDAWAAGQRRVLGEQKYMQEMECVGEDTVITVRNKNTGNIEKITIGELYSKIELRLSMLENKINNQYEVLTPDGWSDFSNIKRKLSSNLIKITFTDNSDIICTKDHLFEIDQHTFVYANFVKSGQVLSNKIVKEIIGVKEQKYVYDLVNVDKWSRYYTNDLVSHNCTFLGSAGTLISAAALGSMAFSRPIDLKFDGKLEIYEEPVPGNFYVMAVDSSRGQALDYSAFLVINTSKEPFTIAAKYRNNTISPMHFPDVLVQTAKHYNEAYLLIENNDVGAQVADLTFYELEYDNMFHGEEANGRYYLTQGRAKQLGIKTTKRSKRQGCNSLKELIENQRLLIQDFNVIEELSTFVMKRDQTYAAEEGSNDDLAMCLVIFAWLTSQPYFRDLTSFDIREKLYQEKMKQIEEEMPLPFYNEVEEVENPKYYRSVGLIWETVEETDGAALQDFYKNWYQ